jgi:hypothetical protein
MAHQRHYRQCINNVERIEVKEKSIRYSLIMSKRYLENSSIDVFDQVKETFDAIYIVLSIDNKMIIGLLITNLFSKTGFQLRANLIQFENLISF